METKLSTQNDLKLTPDEIKALEPVWKISLKGFQGAWCVIQALDVDA
ncbi:hypothetical protein [Acetobacter aceti]|uniref:Uncharacterized protein n=1 Tax=Acetobacter aceti TaxID=435 RepID=A0A6S6PKV2_ACEAC|nr:hypothetical protein [Acetobacter aceti]BCI65874.1 hypothetical protein AAJCM20276_04980 [Acetobacter aceti]